MALEGKIQIVEHTMQMTSKERQWKIIESWYKNRFVTAAVDLPEGTIVLRSSLSSCHHLPNFIIIIIIHDHWPTSGRNHSCLLQSKAVVSSASNAAPSWKGKTCWRWQTDQIQPITRLFVLTTNNILEKNIQPGWPVAQTVGCHCATNASTPRHLQTTTPAMPPIRRSFSGTRLNAICWRRTLSRSPWRRRMRRRLQRWFYQKLQGITSINHHQVLSLVSPLRLLLLPEDWKELESHIEAREDTPIFIYNSRCSISSHLDSS